MRPRSVDRVREDLLHNGVAAVVGLGLSQWDRLSVNTAWYR